MTRGIRKQEETSITVRLVAIVSVSKMICSANRMKRVSNRIKKVNKRTIR